MANLTEDCSAVRPLLSAYADGEATATESALIKGHLAHCAACASQFAFTRAMNVALGAAPIEKPSPELFARIAAATFARPTLRQRIAEWLTPAPTRWAMGTALAVIALAIVIPRNDDAITAMTRATPDAGLAKNTPAINTVATNGTKAPVTAAPAPVAPTPTAKTLPDAKAAIIARADSERKAASAPKNPAISKAIARKAVRVAEGTLKTNAPRDDSPQQVAQNNKRTIAPDSGERMIVAPPRASVVAHNNASSHIKSPPMTAQTQTAPPSHKLLTPETKPVRIVAAAPLTPAETNPTPIKPEPQPRVAAQEPEGVEGVKVAMAESPRENNAGRLSFRLTGATRRQDFTFAPVDTSGASASKAGNISIVGARGGL